MSDDDQIPTLSIGEWAIDQMTAADLPEVNGAIHPTMYAQSKAEFLLAGEPEEQVLVGLERSDCFTWGEGFDFLGAGPRLLRSGFIGRPPTAEAWLFDHIPKTGGSEFAAIADRHLYSHDHLFVRWVASWFGVVLGRLERAVLVHGHGARYAEQLAPWRTWRTALCVREPCEAVVSTYQQYAKMQKLSGRVPQTLEEWLEVRLDRPDPMKMNRQVRWLGLDHPPVFKRAAESNPHRLGMDELLAPACQRLDMAEIVGTPDTIQKVFARLTRAAPLRVRPDTGARLWTNASEIPSKYLLRRLSANIRDALQQATRYDQILFERAAQHDGRVF